MSPHDDSKTRTDLFIERLRRSFSHDLRTPLGSIVNYAAALEAIAPGSTEELRDVARRIRNNAQRAARMAETMATAMKLSATRSPSATATTDLVLVLRAILIDGGARSPHVVASGPAPSLQCDAEILGFAWRALLAFESDAAGQPVSSLRVTQQRTAEQCDRVELSVPAEADLATPTVDLEAFVRHSDGSNRLDTALALQVACELLSLHAHVVNVSGRPGHGIVMRVTLPRVR